MSHYAYGFCSPDYRSGFDQLSNHLLEALDQLHELKKFVLSYINFFNSNSEFMGRLAVNSFPIDSSYRDPKEKDNILNGHRGNDNKKASKEIDLKHIFRSHIDRVALELELQLNLSADIDINVYGKLLAFIKNNEPQIRKGLSIIADLLDEYDFSFKTMEENKEKYLEMVLLGEASGIDHRIEHESEAGLSEPLLAPSGEGNDSTSDQINPTGSQRHETFEFPLDIGAVVKFDTKELLKSFLTKTIKGIPTVKRKIPFPGYRNEIFQGEQLCDWLKTNRPFGFTPLRSNIEKLGQGLLDLKLLHGFGIFAKRFRSEGSWYEWSELAINFIEDQVDEDAYLSLPSQRSSANLSDKILTDVSQTTNRSLNSVLKTFASSLSKKKFLEEVLKELEVEYNNSYEDFQRLRHLLDTELLSRSESLEKFEKLRIELIYHSLTKLLEIMHKHSIKSTHSLQEFTKRFIESYNKPENFLHDFEKNFQKFSTGIFFPSMMPADALDKKLFDASHSNTLYQNIKLNFNLYKDIALQLNVSSTDKASVLSLRSVPVFLISVVEILYSSSSIKSASELQELWLIALDHQDYWSTKYEIINLIQKFTPPDELNIHDENAVELTIIKNICGWLEGKDSHRIMNFFKNWLLESSDSVIPCTVYDSILKIYDRSTNPEGNYKAALTRVLCSIPRCNLSSLIFILESLCNAFDIEGIAGYGSKDELDFEETKESSDHESTAKKLNDAEAIGSVPFLHLILRPSVMKNFKGFKPPLAEYNMILLDLLDLQVRKDLLHALISNEQKVIDRNESQKNKLAIDKRALKRVISLETPSAEKSRISNNKELLKSPEINAQRNSPRIVNNGGEEFAPRPFRVTASPRPASASSNQK